MIFTTAGRNVMEKRGRGEDRRDKGSKRESSEEQGKEEKVIEEE